MVRALALALGASLLATPALSAELGLVKTVPLFNFTTETLADVESEIAFNSVDRVNSTEFATASVSHVSWSFAPPDGERLVFGEWDLNTDVAPLDKALYYQFYTYNKTIDIGDIPYANLTLVGNIQINADGEVTSDVPVSLEPNRNAVVDGQQENPRYVAFPEDMAVFVEFRFTDDVADAEVPLTFVVSTFGQTFGLPRDETTGYVISAIAGVSVLLTIFLLYKDREEIAGKRRDRIMKLRKEEARRVQM